MQQLIIVGKLVNIYGDFIEVKSMQDGSIFAIQVSPNIMDNIRQYCNIEDVVGVRCKVTCTEGKVNLQADKITFLSSTKGGEENGNE